MAYGIDSFNRLSKGFAKLLFGDEGDGSLMRVERTTNTARLSVCVVW
jgi:hypothetical protein